jgi:hypothetical protein|tara:strand:+ start:1826 stop:2041 length:216 start_codon:yes stop_codon:yes gene_type:complete
MKLYDVQPTYTKKEDSVSPYDSIQIERSMKATSEDVQGHNKVGIERIAELEAELLKTQKELQYITSLFIND